MAKITWLGDTDPSVQSIDQFGYSFVKGEAVEVDEKTSAFAKLKANPAFSTDKAKPIDSNEPEKPDPDEGTELAAVRKELDLMHVKYDGRSGLDSLRTKLAEAKAKQ